MAAPDQSSPYPEGQELGEALTQSLSGPTAEVLRRALLGLASAAASTADLLRRGALAGRLEAETAKPGEGGDKQKRLDVLANALMVKALSGTGTAYFASEEEDEILTLDPGGALAIAVDPLDGSTNIDINAAIGAIFCVFDASPAGPEASFFRSGRDQVAAGYVIYGPHTDLIITTGAGVHQFVLDLASGTFVAVRSHLRVPAHAYEFAVNASNYRHWFEPVQTFIDECFAGAEGPRGADFNMRWPGAMVVDAHRILTRGGIYMYPADRRRGYEHGRLRLLYEAFPVAMLMEQAGGRATDGDAAILDKTVSRLHQRTPLIFGSARDVAILARHYERPERRLEQAPLFGYRGLFRT